MDAKQLIPGNLYDYDGPYLTPVRLRYIKSSIDQFGKCHVFEAVRPNYRYHNRYWLAEKQTVPGIATIDHLIVVEEN